MCDCSGTRFVSWPRSPHAVRRATAARRSGCAALAALEAAWSVCACVATGDPAVRMGVSVCLGACACVRRRWVCRGPAVHQSRRHVFFIMLDLLRCACALPRQCRLHPPPRPRRICPCDTEAAVSMWPQGAASVASQMTHEHHGGAVHVCKWLQQLCCFGDTALTPLLAELSVSLRQVKSDACLWPTACRQRPCHLRKAWPLQSRCNW